MLKSLRRKMKDRRGNESIEFLVSCALLILSVITLLSVMAYVMRYYNVNYACRKTTRFIETSGKYSVTDTNNFFNQITGGGADTTYTVNASYFQGNRIQLRTPFSVTVNSSYKIKILSLGSHDVEVVMPIQVTIRGMSEVYWKALPAGDPRLNE